MARTSGVLLAAARAYKREDRLTELLAVVLNGSSGLARRLFSEAGLSIEPAECDVSTQHRTRRGKYVDLQVLALDARGHPVARLWSEHKSGAGYSPGQLRGYAHELTRLPGLGKLVTIVDSADEARVPAGDWKVWTWQKVGRWAWEIVETATDPGLRQAAVPAPTSGEGRLLYELITYLEEVHDIVLDPLSHLDVIAFAHANQVHELMPALLNRAGTLTEGMDVYETATWDKDEHSDYWLTYKDTGTWARRLSGTIELVASASDEWTYQRMGEPTIAAGFGLPEQLYEPLSSTQLGAWREPLEQAGFTVGVVDKWTRVYRTMYVAELIAKGATFDDQAQAIADFAAGTIESLKSADPGIKRPPRPTPRRRHKALPPADSAATTEAEAPT